MKCVSLARLCRPGTIWNLSKSIRTRDVVAQAKVTPKDEIDRTRLDHQKNGQCIGRYAGNRLDRPSLKEFNFNGCG